MLMPRNIFITGLPKSGKTTLLQKLVDELKKRGKKVGGFITPAKIEHGTREGFYVEDIETGRTAQLASLSGGGPKVSKYSVKIKEFESVALPAMRKVDKYEVFVLDEIGRMEMKSRKFVEFLEKVFESKTLLIASISEDYAPVYGFQGEIILLTPTNREGVYLELLRKALETPVERVKRAEVIGPETSPAQKKARAVRRKGGPKAKKEKKAQKRKGERKKEKIATGSEKKEIPPKAGEKKSFFRKISDLLGF